MSSLNNSKADHINESRYLYIKNNKSDIFQTSNLPTNSTKETIRNHSEFTPKYKVESAVERRMKEFHNISDKSGKSSCYGKLNQDVMIVPVKQIDISETAKVRRIKDMYLSLESRNNNSNNSFVLNSSYKIDNPDERTEKKIDVANRNSKINRVESLKSNIFYSEAKLKENINSTSINIKTNNNDEKTESNPPKKVTNKTLVSTVFDWTKTNTEVIFKNKHPTKDINNNSSPSMRKLRNLVSEFDEPKVKNFQTVKDNLNNETEDQKREITEIMKERLGSNQSKLKKNFENFSQLHNHETYMNDLKINKKDRQIECFSVENIKNFDRINVNKIKSLYAKNGIHIYDVNLNGKPCQGDKVGSISFKIRKNEDVADFDNKLKQVKESLTKETGEEVKTKFYNTTKPKTDINSGHIQRKEMIEKKNNLDKTDFKYTNITKHFSNTPVKFDISYKNPYNKKVANSGKVDSKK